MASRRLVIGTATQDAISTEEIRRVEVPSIVNLWASTDDVGDTLGLLLNRTEILPVGEVNLEAAVNVIDTSRDQLLFNTVVGRGQLRMPASVVTTETVALLSVEPILR